MTFLEKALEEKKKQIIQHHCPADLCEDTTLDLDTETEVNNESGYSIGCRGFSCEECWNQK